MASLIVIATTRFRRYSASIVTIAVIIITVVVVKATLGRISLKPQAGIHVTAVAKATIVNSRKTLTAFLTLTA